MAAKPPPKSEATADLRARQVEQQMTDDERLSLLVSVFGENPRIPLPRDERIPEGTLLSSGYTPGVPRLGVPALRMSDASMGVINPGFANREGDPPRRCPRASRSGRASTPNSRAPAAT